VISLLREMLEAWIYYAPNLAQEVQMVGALLWVIYGVLIKASPVIVANVLILSVAAWTTFRRQSEAS
jgi:hypothetical protein